MGFVFQEPTLMPWATVFGNVFLPLKLTAMTSRRCEMRASGRRWAVGLADFARAYPRELPAV